MTDFNSMTAEEFLAWQKQQAAAAGIPVANSVPDPAPQPSRTAWADRKAANSLDFTCPSGQLCRLRKVTPEELLRQGILDKVTRLEGLADDLVNLSEGVPPEKQKMPSTEDFASLLETINTFVRLAVAEPIIYADDDENLPEDGVRVSDIDLEDRLAIMEFALRGVRSLDRFRHPR
jgi:hypothetical protein